MAGPTRVTWLCSIARNKLDRPLPGRRIGSVAVTCGLSPCARSSRRLPRPDQVGDRDALVAALHQLPDIERTALVLRYLDDLSVRDVAELLGRSVDGTDALIRRAKERFRTIYPEAFDD